MLGTPNFIVETLSVPFDVVNSTTLLFLYLVLKLCTINFVLKRSHDHEPQATYIVFCLYCSLASQ